MTWWYSNSRRLALLTALPSLTLVSAVGPAGEDRTLENAPRLSLPVACDMARDCSIQKYVDRAPGPGRLDYHCGKLTTDGHDGIDFRLRRPWDMQRNVAVVAAAHGKILRVRDGMRDISVKDPSATIAGRLAGNGVVIDHGGGWESQYSHLKQYSVRVKQGDHVKAGDAIGVIGMSGNAEFPHLHFEVRHYGKTIDPFAPSTATGCSDSRGSLWAGNATILQQYRDTIVLAADFAASPADAMNAYQQARRTPSIVNPEQLLIWGITSGSKSGDTERFQVHDPKRGLILQREARISESTLQRVAFAGLKRPQKGWIPGLYRGSYTLIRDGKIFGSAENSILIKSDLLH
jgi:hypothetical protein